MADEDETLLERIYGLNEMFPRPVKQAANTTVSLFKSLISGVRSVTWFACSTSAILLLPISLEVERQQYHEQMKRQERNILLGPDSNPI